MSPTVRIEVLGELRVFGPGGERIELPPSRKTRALLAYLGLTARPQFREHLCDLLWDGPDDPRGALRWSLSRLRAALDGAQAKRLESDRRTIGLASQAFSIDLRDAESALEVGADAAALDSLREIAELFRGDLLEGLDLLDCFRFHTWCVGQRERARALRLRVLAALVDRAPELDERLKYAHALVSIDPLTEASHLRVIDLLMQMARHHDAQAQADSYRHTLEIELGEVPRDVAARLREAVHGSARQQRPESPRREERAAVVAVPVVGRAVELATLTSWLRSDDGSSRLAVVCGPPGAGKTRLVTELADGLDGGARLIHARAYQAESSRAFGPWRDAFADLDGATTALAFATDGRTEQQRRERLFEQLLALVAAQARTAPQLVVTVDDLQWLDEASVAFLHFLARRGPNNMRLLATLRPEEVLDNPEVGEAMESLRGERALLEVALPPLERSEIAQMCAAIDEGVDAEVVFGHSGGNPLLATELARALARGESELPDNVRQLVAARLRILSEPARELLPWAAALGRTFHVDVLERVTRLEALTLLDRVGELEERGVLEPRQAGAYDFTHDLVRDAAYRELSEPRQRIVHRSIARSLDSWRGATGFSATELLRHAELGGEAATASRAGAAAASDALLVCAWVVGSPHARCSSGSTRAT
jgi:DNA-binding SARP family transcriptional activator